MNNNHFENLVQSIQNSALFQEVENHLDLIGLGDANLEFSSAEVNAVYACQDLLTLIIFAYSEGYISRMLVTTRLNTVEEFTEAIFEIQTNCWFEVQQFNHFIIYETPIPGFHTHLDDTYSIWESDTQLKG